MRPKVPQIACVCAGKDWRAPPTRQLPTAGAVPPYMRQVLKCAKKIQDPPEDFPG